MHIYPNAHLYTTVFIPEEMKSLGNHPNVHTSFLQKFPKSLKKKHPFLLPFLPKAIETLDLSEFDIILSSSSFVGKGVITNPNQLHICYCHTPTRYLWGEWQEYLKYFPIPKILKHFLPRYFTKLRIWDSFASARPDIYIANSDYIAEGIEKFYHRSAEVIPPPVHIEKFALGIHEEKQNFYLAFGRLVPQKKCDLLIETFKKHPEWKLKIAGTGRNETELKKLAKGCENIEFLGFVSESEVPKLMGRAKALLFPQLEDAGITALEALAAGTPVIAYGKGGVQTTLKDGETGIFFPEQTPESLTKSIEVFEQRTEGFDQKKLVQHAEHFSTHIFEKKIRQFVQAEWKQFQEQNSIPVYKQRALL